MRGGDRLSVLPDDLLLRILHFAPVSEAASTSALSKRWRGLWCSAGAVNLVARVPESTCKFGVDDDISFFSRRDAFVSGARSALEAAAAAGSTVTRLSFCLEAGHDWRFLYEDKNHGRIDVLADLLSLPAARHVEELRIARRDSGHIMPLIHLGMSSLHTDFYALSFLSLPSETLRVLDLTSFDGLEPSTGVSFPRLESLRMSLCNVRNKHLQAVIDVSPALAAIHLESVVLVGEIAPHTDATGNGAASVAKPPPLEDDLIIRIHCPAATALVLDRCLLTKTSYWEGTAAVEIDAPRLRRFTYKGVLRHLSLTSQATDLARADLHIIRERFRRHEDAGRDLVTFWRFARNFSNAKELKLRVSSFEEIAAASRTKLLCSFRNLECLEIDGTHGLKEKTAAVAIANLLRCCPMLRDLRINLSEVSGDLDAHHHNGRLSLERKYRHDLDKSIHGFENRRSVPVVSFVKQDDDQGDTYDHLSDLPALSGRVFPCLQTSLRRVGLQFRMGKTHNNFGVKLIKFFAQNAMLLEEMQIDGGNGKMQDHINCNVERWFANSSNDRKTSFVFLPLERRNHHDI